MGDRAPVEERAFTGLAGVQRAEPFAGESEGCPLITLSSLFREVTESFLRRSLPPVRFRTHFGAMPIARRVT
jgi:hypothetical protein